MDATTSKIETQDARRGEAVLVVAQNNDDKSIAVVAANALAEAMLGEDIGGLSGVPVINVLGDSVRQIIEEDVEFTDGAKDFGDVFSRLRDIKLRRRNGDEIQVSCRISRLMAQGKNACFQLVVTNEYELLSQQKLQEFIRMNLDGRKELDPATGLPDRNTAKTFLPLLKSYFAQEDPRIVFAVVHLDRFDKSLQRYGKEACTQLLMHVNQCCRATFRSADLIFALSDRALGVVLFDISRESARVVLNRLRWQIRSQRFSFGGKPDFSITTSVGFDLLNLDTPLAAFDACVTAIDEIDPNERNHLIELTPA